MKYFGMESHFPRRYFNPGPSEYEAGAGALKCIADKEDEEVD
jgi:hypothetical protein